MPDYCDYCNVRIKWWHSQKRTMSGKYHSFCYAKGNIRQKELRAMKEKIMAHQKFKDDCY